MWQVLFRIPVLNIPVYGYGLMLVIAFLCATELAKFLARRSRLNPETFVNAGLIALVSGVVGSRLSHVLENWGDYSRADLSFWENLFNAINIRNGGLTFYGGLILGFICTVAYGIWKRVPLRLGMDIVAPAIMVGLGLGRVGCFLNGCCYGAECTLPWGVRFPYYSNAYQEQFSNGEIRPPSELLVATANGPRLLSWDEIRQGYWEKSVRGDDGKIMVQRISVPKDAGELAKKERAKAVQPAELYSTFDGLLIAAVLVAFFAMPHAPGRVFALMLLLMGPSRFLLEMVRAEPPVTWIGNYGLSFSMVLSIFFVVAGTILWFVCGAMGDRREWIERVGGKLAAT